MAKGNGSMVVSENGDTEVAVAVKARGRHSTPEDAIATAVQSIVDHSRELQATNLQLVNILTGSYADLVTEVQNMRLQMRESDKVHLENRKFQEELLDRKDDRRLKRDREKKQNELLEAGGKELLALLPAVANKIMKRPVLTEAETSVLRSFVTSLRQEQLEGVFTLLDTGQQVALGEIIKAIPEDPKGSLEVTREDIEPCPPSSKSTESRSTPVTWPAPPQSDEVSSDSDDGATKPEDSDSSEA